MAMISLLLKSNKLASILFGEKPILSGGLFGKDLISWLNGYMSLSKNSIISKSGNKWSNPIDYYPNSLISQKSIDQKYSSMLWNKKLVEKGKYQSTNWRWNALSKNRILRFSSNWHRWYCKEPHIKETYWKMLPTRRNLRKYQPSTFTIMTSKTKLQISWFHFTRILEDQIF